MKPPTVLVVDDNPIMLKMVRLALESEGYAVLTAEDGRSALELMRKTPPDMVLQDLLLPDIDGRDLVRQLRDTPHGAEIPIVAFTGFLSNTEQARTTQAGFTDFLFKPVEPSRLVQVVRAYTPGTAPAETPDRRRRLLLVDDDPLQLKLLKIRLEQAGYHVRTAGDGQEALEQARRGHPDAIVSDVLMPRLDGFRLALAVRQDPDFSRVPVVLTSSAYTEEADRSLALAMGATDFVLRTPDEALVIEAVKAALEQGAAPAPAPPDTSLIAEYTLRLVRQLEQQVMLNVSLTQRLSLHQAELALLAGFGEAIRGEVGDSTIVEVLLKRCITAAGVSRGAAYLLDRTGGLRLGGQFGYPPSAARALEDFFGRSDLLRSALEKGKLIVAAAPDVPGDSRPAGAGSVLVAPIASVEKRHGVLVMDSATRDVGEDWAAFAQAVGFQIGQALALAEAFARLKAQEKRYREVFERAVAGIYLSTLEGRFVIANAALARIFGYDSPAELIEAITDPGSEMYVDPGRRAELVRLLDEQGQVLRFESRARAKDGRVFWIAEDIRAVRDERGKVHHYEGTVVDITDVKRAEEALRRSEERYRALFESSPFPMWVFDPETLRFLAVNDAAIEHYGYGRAEFLSMTLADIRPPEDVEALRRDIAAPQTEANRGWRLSGTVWRHRKKDGALIDVEISAHDVPFGERQARVVLANDVTERRRLEEQLRQAQKMEAIGQLAGGVAHDFNNLLGVITGYSELVLRDLGPQHPAHSRIEEIRKAADRAAGLTRQLLAFSRKQVLQPSVLDLNVVVGDIEKMLRRLIGEHIELRTVLNADLGRVRADPGQIEQVIVNLVVNARDAMPGGGKLILETANVRLDEAYLRSHANVQPGPYVLLAVSDTGHGMDNLTMSRIFEPFFTTKDPGKGTGLGLSTAYGIVQQSGGHVQVYSEPGHGSTFKIYLPLLEKEDRAAEAAAAAMPPLSSGSETVLLVEDAESLRVMIREVLEDGGYTVLEADAPEAALSLARAHAGPIHLMLTDVVMPGMSGRETADQAKAARPDMRVLYMSGYTDEAISHHGQLEPGTHFIQKPFAGDALLRKVREVLDAPEERPSAG